MRKPVIFLIAVFSPTAILIAGCSFLKPEVVFQYPAVGMSIKLPDSWRGFEVESSYWEGHKSDPELGDVIVESGPMISIQHPLSSSENPRQNIPIMIITLEQWNSLQAKQWHIGAAPVIPIELGRNSQFVFALPARYNYAFPDGWEEVEEILWNENIQINEP